MYSSSSSHSMEMEEGTVSVSPTAVAAAEASRAAPPAAAGVVAADSARTHHLPEEEEEEASGADHQGDQDSSSTESQHGANSSHMVVKGKRTKRPRTSPATHPHQSPGAAASSTSNSYQSGHSSGVTEEEEDMANCLILLAQGDPHGATDAAVTSKRHEEKGGGHSKASSRRFAEASSVSAAAGCSVVKAGFYVYECKTCSRCFPTFQALGGHRASHKKPKMGVVDSSPSPSCAAAGHLESEERARPLEQVLIEDHHHLQAPLMLDSPATPILPPTSATVSRILHNNNSYINMETLINQSSKSTMARVHECSICGSEFQSGQALGGHMRRHRAAAATVVPTASTVQGSPPPQLSDNPASKNAEVVMTTKTVVLPLDLNLPAPSDDAEFPKAAAPPPAAFLFSAPSKRPPMLFSASPLVDCHY